MKAEEILKTKTSKSPRLRLRLLLKLTGKRIEILMQQQAAAAPNQVNQTILQERRKP